MIVRMSEVWSSYKRQQVNINKAVPNSEVAGLLQIHYKYLHSRLVKSDRDEGIFNDTFLKLTYKYNPNRDFIEQYLYYFNLLKGAYYRDDKVANYYLDLVDTYNKIDIPPQRDEYDEPKDKPKLSDIKADIQSYAISKKSYKRKSQNH